MSSQCRIIHHGMQTWRLAIDIVLLFCEGFTAVSTDGNIWLIACDVIKKKMST